MISSYHEVNHRNERAAPKSSNLVRGSFQPSYYRPSTMLSLTALIMRQLLRDACYSNGSTPEFSEGSIGCQMAAAAATASASPASSCVPYPVKVRHQLSFAITSLLRFH